MITASMQARRMYSLIAVHIESIRMSAWALMNTLALIRTIHPSLLCDIRASLIPLKRRNHRTTDTTQMRSPIMHLATVNSLSSREVQALQSFILRRHMVLRGPQV